MNILLIGINAKYSHTSLAVYSISAFLDSKNIKNTVCEYTINDSYLSIFYDIVNKKPDIIGFSTYIWNIGVIKRLISDLKKAITVKIVLGGPEAGYSDESFCDVDKIISSNGEVEFLNYLTDFSDTTEFSDLPFPYMNALKTGKTAYYEASRGCPYNCGYCVSAIEKNVSFKRLNDVKRDILFFINNGFKKVKFIDRTFNINKNTREIFEFIMENDNSDICFHFEIKAELFSKNDILLLSKARKGLFQFEIGIQSLNGEVLAAINRENDIERVFLNIKKLIENDNIRIHLDLIAGLPYEDINSFIKGFNAVYKLKPHILQLGFLKILNGTPMKSDDILDLHQIKYSSAPPYQIISTKYLSVFDVIDIHTCEEGLETISNKGFFKNSLRFLFKNNDIEFYDFFKMCGEKLQNSPPLSMPDLFSMFYNVYCANNFYDKDSFKERLISDFKIKNPNKQLNLQKN